MVTKKKHATHAHKHATHHAAEHKHKEEDDSLLSQAKSAPSDSLKNAAIIVLSLAVIAVLIWGLSNNLGAKTPKTAGVSGTVKSAGDLGVTAEMKAQMLALADDDPFIGAADAPVTIVLFSDFQCPYSAMFWQQTLPPVKEAFVDNGVVKLVYRDLPLSFHENAQNAAEAAQCAHEQGAFWTYHDLLFANQAKLDVNSLKKYAADAGLDVAQFATCLDTHKYAQETADDAAAAAQNGISGTPGFIINGQLVSGALPYDQFEQKICVIVPEAEPCKNMEPPVPVDVVVLTDQRCTSCETLSITSRTTELFPGAKYRTIDVSSSEGKALVEKYGLVYAPAYIFSPDVVQTKSWTSQPQLASFFIELSDGSYRLRDEAVGASWFISEEQRAAYYAQLNAALGIEEGVPQVDFFVMSYCPYGNQAEELLKPVYDQLKGQARFVPRYVVYSQYGGGGPDYCIEDGKYCSMHGIQELNQNVRELCVYDSDGEQAWFDFAIAMNSECTYQNADSCWTGVAAGLGLDTAAIESCFAQNKAAYAKEQYDLGMMLGVSGSPTVFFNGELYNGARTSNGYLSALCAGFDAASRPAACSGAVEEPVQAVTGSC